MADSVANPLTLVMEIESKDDYKSLKELLGGLQGLPPDQNPIRKALTAIGTVHYARFVFLDETHLAIITTSDGRLKEYIDAFVNVIGSVFDKLFAHVKDAPPLPTSDHRQEFLDYVKRNDRPCVGS